jgi:hypothetical protein
VQQKNQSKLMAMLTAYLDESGHETKGWMFVAGFMGNDEQWSNFCPLWKQGLGKRKALHMANLRWNKPLTKRLLERLGPIPNACGLTPVLGGVNVSDYEDLVTGTYVQKLLKGYITCVYPLVINVLRSLPKNERLELVFEQQDEYEPFTDGALAAIVSLRFTKPDWFITDDGLPKLAKWSFVPKSSTMLTQPADYFVYALRKMYEDEHSERASWCEPILKSGGGSGIGMIFKRKDIREAMLGLPVRAIFTQAMRQMGKLEGLKLTEKTKSRLRELRLDDDSINKSPRLRDWVGTPRKKDD